MANLLQSAIYIPHKTSSFLDCCINLFKDRPHKFNCLTLSKPFLNTLNQVETHSLQLMNAQGQLIALDQPWLIAPESPLQLQDLEADPNGVSLDNGKVRISTNDEQEVIVSYDKPWSLAEGFNAAKPLTSDGFCPRL